MRGNHRQKTFLHDRDYQAYLNRLTHYRRQFGVTVYAYTQYFNRKHNKVGHLLQGRYKAIVGEKDEYLLSLVRYIHLNPVRARLVHNVDEYPYCGYRKYCSSRASEVLEPSRVLNMLGGRAAYRRFVQEGLKDGHREEYYDVSDQRFLGEACFVEKLKVQSRRGSGRAPPDENRECRIPYGRSSR